MSDPKRLMRGGGLGKVLLDSGRTVSPGPDDRERDALWGRLAAELPGLGVGAGAAGAVLAAPGARAALGGAKAMSALALAKGTVALLLAVAIGTAGSVAALRWHGHRASAAAVERAEALPLAEQTMTPPAAVGPVLELDPEVDEAATPIVATPHARASQDVRIAHTSTRAISTPPLPPSPARSEAMLLLDSRAALRSGDCGKALGLLDEAHARFATGSLAEEREVLFIQGLDCAGRKGEAEARRADFVRAHPLSAYDVSPSH